MKFKRLLRTYYNQMVIQYTRGISLLGLGSLPEFIIIGAQKGGTTSLYQHLISHPQILGAKIKELHFFSVNYHRGMRWYKACFPTFFQRTRQSKAVGLPVITGEASPDYLVHPDTPQLLSKALPNVKLIALLRNPVDRLVSQYYHMVRVGWESLPIKEAIARDVEYLAGGNYVPQLKNQLHPLYKPTTFSYLARGCYIEQLERYASHFKKEQMLILKSETFFTNTQVEYNKVLTFLGVAPHILSNFKVANKGTYDKKARNTEIKQELQAYFKPYNERLYEFLGEDLSW